MKTGASRTLAVALGVAVAGLAAGCSLFPKKYELDVEAAESVVSQLQSLYVIVASKNDVQEALSSKTKYEDLLDEVQIKKYLTFVQYEPLHDGSWRLVNEVRASEFVEVEIDERTLEVVVDHDLVEKSRTDYALVVLANFGSAGFEQQTVEHADLDAAGSQVVEVGPGSLLLRSK